MVKLHIVRPQCTSQYVLIISFKKNVNTQLHLQSKVDSIGVDGHLH